LSQARPKARCDDEAVRAWRRAGQGGLETAEQRLNGHQRDTLAHIFRHPLSHNLEWHSVTSLLQAVGQVQETHKGHLLVTIGGETETFDPRHKDIDAEQLTLLRKLLTKSGYSPDGGPK
jgi:hypothetical protein